MHSFGVALHHHPLLLASNGRALIPPLSSPAGGISPWRRRRRPSSGSFPSVADRRIPFIAASSSSSPIVADPAKFMEAAKQGNLVPLQCLIFSDQLTPVTAYRCLVRENDVEAPSFLFESVEQGSRVALLGRYSFVGAYPAIEIVAKENRVTIVDHERDQMTEEITDDPMAVPRSISQGWKVSLATCDLPAAFCGGWVGFFSYDAVRYAEKEGIPLFAHATEDDLNLPDMHLGLYNDVLVFDHVEKASEFGPSLKSSMTSQEYKDAVVKAKEHVLAGDVSQVVLSQRFERRTYADPFQVYRAMRVVNPSPYMAYMQARGCILVSSSPQILTRVKKNKVVNRPLAGTIRRGETAEEDQRLEKELLNDPNQCAEHTMLVDLARNDVGKISECGSVKAEKLMEIERYSNVMHMSSTVTGILKNGLTCWDALGAALPAGTVTGAPKVRAMELIDSLEAKRRGPYSGGFGGVSFMGDMDVALALRTIVFPTSCASCDAMYSAKHRRRQWLAYIQAGAGIVADSVSDDEHVECQNKAAGPARAIDLAESTFLGEET